MVDGVTKLIMMKSDVLDGFDEIKACVAYRINGEETDIMPFDLDDAKIEPVYVTMPGWKTDMTKFRSEEQFPKAFTDYIKFLEKNWQPLLPSSQSARTANRRLSGTSDSADTANPS